MYMLLSNRMNGRNDQEEQWNRMRSVVCCDVINLPAALLHNGRPWRDASQSLRFWHRPLRSIFLPVQPHPASLFAYVLHPNSDTVRNSNANSLTHSMRGSTWMASRNQLFKKKFNFYNCRHTSSHCPLTTVCHRFRSHPIRVAGHYCQIMCPFVKPFGSRHHKCLTQPVTEY